MNHGWMDRGIGKERWMKVGIINGWIDGKDGRKDGGMESLASVEQLRSRAERNN